MEHLWVWLVFLAYCSFFNQCESKTPQEDVVSYILSRLTDNRHKPPIVVYLKSKQNYRSSEENSEDIIQKLRVNEENSEDLKQNFRFVGENRGELNNRHNDEKDISDENVSAITAMNERAYVLYHLLRTVTEEEGNDQQTDQNLESTKEFLRNTFIGRCRNLKTCLRQCAPLKPKRQKKFTCTVQCKEIFDDLNECDEPKAIKCKPPKCGHTMPPSWL